MLDLFRIESGSQSGAFNMAMDEALLETLRLGNIPTMIVRTYRWEVPTLSLGVHQPERDLSQLLAQYGENVQIVRRPTGGRAILHGEDISFSFVTNDPALLKASLKESYRQLSGYVKTALDAMGLQTSESGESDAKAYLRSPVCFQTRTDSDLVIAGHKLTGSAQLRRANGLLQHGALFVKEYGYSPDTFSQVLFDTIAQAHDVQTLPEFPLEMVMPLCRELEARYDQDGKDIRARASTTAGSHLTSASF